MISNGPKARWIKCPSCKGSGKCLGLAGTKCRWCDGCKRVGKKQALKYAGMTVCFAFGSFVEGGTVEEYHSDLAQANAIRKHFGEEPLRP